MSSWLVRYIYIIKEESQGVPNDIGSNNNYIDMKNAMTECNPTLETGKSRCIKLETWSQNWIGRVHVCRKRDNKDDVSSQESHPSHATSSLFLGRSLLLRCLFLGSCLLLCCWLLLGGCLLFGCCLLLGCLHYVNMIQCKMNMTRLMENDSMTYIKTNALY